MLLDTTVPICGNSAQRPHGEISNDGPKNLTDSVEYIASRVWADENGRNRAGVIVLQEQQIFAAREVMKVDARPGGYVATGGHGGIIGGMGYHGAAVLHYVPALKHTYLSEVNLSKIPTSVPVAHTAGGGIALAPVRRSGTRTAICSKARFRRSRSSRTAAITPRNISIILR